MERWFGRNPGWTLIIFTWLGLVAGWVSGYATARADVFEVELNAQRDGWARLHAEGLWVERDPALGRYSVMSSRGKPTVRRVKVEKGPNTIRVRAIRWEDEEIPLEHQLARMLGSNGVIPVVSMPVNAAFVWGRVAGREFNRTIQPEEATGSEGEDKQTREEA